MSDTETVEVRKRKEGVVPLIAAIAAAPAGMAVMSFGRNVLREIFDLYGRNVAGGEWRDYGIGFPPQKWFFGLETAIMNSSSVGAIPPMSPESAAARNILSSFTRN